MPYGGTAGVREKSRDGQTLCYVGNKQKIRVDGVTSLLPFNVKKKGIAERDFCT